MKMKGKKKERGFVSIKTKLLGVILPIVGIIVIVLAGLSYHVSKKVIKSDAEGLLETSVKSQASDIEAWLNQNLTSFQVEKQALEKMNLDDEQLQAYLDAYYGFDNNYPDGLYVADGDGTLHEASALQPIVLRDPNADGNYVNNGDLSAEENFSDGADWEFFTAEGGEGSVEVRDGEIAVDIANEGTVDYSLQLVQANVPMKNGAEYRVSFDAYAEENRSMKVGISGPDHDYVRYLEDTVVELTPEKQTYSYDFTMTGEDDANGRLEFNMGLAGSTAGVRIGNISIVMTADAPGAEDTKDPEAEAADVLASEWFQAGLGRVNMGFTNAYTRADGRQVISACGTLRTDSGDIRVLSADLSLDKVSVYVNSFVKMEGAEAFLVNKEDNSILAARDTELISQKLSDISDGFMNKVGEKIAADDLGLTEIDGRMTVFGDVDGTEWMLVSYIPTRLIYQDLDNLRNLMVLFGVVSILILLVLIERVVHIVIRPVKQLTGIIETMTDGDFTIHSTTKSNDEIGVMSRRVEKFIETMCGMIASINGVSNTLHNQADSSRDISNQMFDASRRQNDSMKELNTTVEQLSISVNGIAKSATTLSLVVAETRGDGDVVSGKMKETVEVSEKGKAVMQDVSGAMQEINQSVHTLQLAIDKVGTASEEITNITRVIGGIAEETNLLSLNASIEAARAGEAGRGFAVVATEIGKLAQTSVESVQHIDNLVLEIKSSIGDVVNQANESVESINNSSKLIDNAVQTFDIIFDNILSVGDLVQNMIHKVEQVEDVAGDVAAISEEQAASSEEILASSDELVEQANHLMANSGTVATESEELTASAQELAAQIGAFQIRD